MPMDRSKYPANWGSISRAIRQRANWRCEWCGVQNAESISRRRNDPSDWRAVLDVEFLTWDERIWTHPVTIVLTVHHIGVRLPDGTPGDPNDKMDCRPENLVALCQRCHLNADAALHVSNRRANAMLKALNAGQMMLPFE
jgi:hypothetical protein